jgi:hypothetical protein
MQQALTANADDARKAGAAARALAQRLAQSSGGQKQGGTPPQSPAGEQRAAAARQMLADAATQQALKSVQRMHAAARSKPAASQRAGKGASPTQPGQPGSGSSARTVSVQPGRIVPGEVPLGSDPRERAQFYQLPPRLREPLLEGMQERGPEGYQPMIDAYFRELSKEIK